MDAKRKEMMRISHYSNDTKLGSQAFFKEAKRNILNQKERGICEKGFCRKFVGGVEVPYNYSTEWTYYPENKEVTLISTVTHNRIDFVNELVEQWNGPICMSLWTHDYQKEKIEEAMSQLTHDSRFTLILYSPSREHSTFYNFPVNLLRNICIRNIQTSHFVTLDADMWPTKSMHSVLLSLPPSVLDSRSAAVVIPPIFYDEKIMRRTCKSLASCIRKSRQVAPTTKEELVECVSKERCLLSKPGGNAHELVTTAWLNIPSNISFVKIRCLPYDLQEPYLMLKYTDFIPLYDERFINYGYNKIQYVEHLRLFIDSLYILTQEFAVDAYHQKSKFARDFKNFINTDVKPDMDVLWNIFRNELRASYSHYRKKIPTCHTRRASLYFIWKCLF